MNLRTTLTLLPLSATTTSAWVTPVARTTRGDQRLFHHDESGIDHPLLDSSSSDNTAASTVTAVPQQVDDMQQQQPPAAAALELLDDENVAHRVILNQKNNNRVMSKAIPFVECPPLLVDCDFAGNVGFDPLGLASSPEKLWEYREAEIKHARLAMLAAVGWPLSEYWDEQIALWRAGGDASLLDVATRAPTPLNGHISPKWWGFVFGLSAAIDLYAVAKKSRNEASYRPGMLGFDPAGLYPETAKGRRHMDLAEIKHGRLAMVAVVIYLIDELVTKSGVIDDIPALIRPISEVGAGIAVTGTAAESIAETMERMAVTEGVERMMLE